MESIQEEEDVRDNSKLVRKENIEETERQLESMQEENSELVRKERTEETERQLESMQAEEDEEDVRENSGVRKEKINRVRQIGTKRKRSTTAKGTYVRTYSTLLRVFNFQKINYLRSLCYDSWFSIWVVIT